MRVFLDQNLPLALLEVSRQAGHDALHAQDEGFERTRDQTILAFCCAEQRVLITADKRLTKFLASSRADCPSVLMTRDVRTMHAQDLGRLIAANLPAIAGVIDEHGHAVFTLAPSKPIRASLLPLGLRDKE